MSKYITGFFDGLRGSSITMTSEQSESCSHQGECFEDCEALARETNIAKQLDRLGAELILQGLKETGAWDFDELEDDDENRIRAVWLAACDAKENQKAGGK